MAGAVKLIKFPGKKEETASYGKKRPSGLIIYGAVPVNGGTSNISLTHDRFKKLIYFESIVDGLI